ncbi:MAG: hypothetical protein MUO72_18585 [Bacteroidales bacterium]|nr:hypothetical protein [Bacteroidales bacterium]
MSRINYHLPKGTKPVKVIGLSDRPSEDIVDGSFECVQVIEKADKTGSKRVWVPLILYGEKKNYSRLFEGSVLVGLDNSPVVDDNGRLGIDESMKVTWVAGMKEPAFKPTK